MTASVVGGEVAYDWWLMLFDWAWPTPRRAPRPGSSHPGAAAPRECVPSRFADLPIYPGYIRSPRTDEEELFADQQQITTHQLVCACNSGRY